MLRKIVLVGIVLLITLAIMGQAIADNGESGSSGTSPVGSSTSNSTSGNISTGTSEVSISGTGADLSEPHDISSRAGGIFGRAGKVGYTGFGLGVTGPFSGMRPCSFRTGFGSLNFDWRYPFSDFSCPWR